MTHADTLKPNDDRTPIENPSPPPKEPKDDPMPHLGPSPPMDEQAAIEETEEQPS